MDTGCVQVVMAVDTGENADRIAAALVDERLAACVQVIGPIRSTYHWRGSVERAAEWLCLAKTTAAASEALMARIAELHSYDTPEITAVPIEHGSAAYLDWIRAETR